MQRNRPKGHPYDLLETRMAPLFVRICSKTKSVATHARSPLLAHVLDVPGAESVGDSSIQSDSGVRGQLHSSVRPRTHWLKRVRIRGQKCQRLSRLAFFPGLLIPLRNAGRVFGPGDLVARLSLLYAIRSLVWRGELSGRLLSVCGAHASALAPWQPFGRARGQFRSCGLNAGRATFCHYLRPFQNEMRRFSVATRFLAHSSASSQALAGLDTSLASSRCLNCFCGRLLGSSLCSGRDRRPYSRMGVCKDIYLVHTEAIRVCGESRGRQ